jgi:hypothetical protein
MQPVKYFELCSKQSCANELNVTLHGKRDSWRHFPLQAIFHYIKEPRKMFSQPRQQTAAIESCALSTLSRTARRLQL